VLREHEKLLKAKRRKWVTPADFRRAVEEDGRLWTVINGSVYDVAGLIGNDNNGKPKHPGGDFLADFVGKDASLWFYTSHLKSENVLTRLSVSWVGYLTDRFGLMCSHDKAMHKLIDDFAAEGLFAYPWRHWLWDMQGPVLFLISFWVAHCCIQGRIAPDWSGRLVYVGSFIGGSLSYVLMLYFVHDALHQSIFTTKERAKSFTRWFSLVVGGIDWSVGAIVHDAHHAFTHVVGRDKSLDTAPLVYWHKSQVPGDSAGALSSAEAFAATWGAFLWFTVVVWLMFPMEVLRSVADAFKRKDVVCLVAVPVRLLLPFACHLSFNVSLHYAVWLLLAQEVGMVLVGIAASLNHFSFDAIDVHQFREKMDQGFVEQQAKTTQNHNAVALGYGLHGANGKQPRSLVVWALVASLDAVVSCWVGHFDYHVEHHLVPYMPRRNLPKVMA